MAQPCQDINIPTTDNTPLTCDSVISTECVVSSDAISYLSLPAESSLKDIITALVSSLSNARARIATLEQIVGELQTE